VVKNNDKDNDDKDNDDKDNDDKDKLHQCISKVNGWITKKHRCFKI
jgi:hypothetical protein